MSALVKKYGCRQDAVITDCFVVMPVSGIFIQTDLVLNNKERARSGPRCGRWSSGTGASFWESVAPKDSMQ